VFKVEADSERTVKLGFYGGGELIQVIRSGGELVVEPNKGLTSISYIPVDEAPRDGYLTPHIQLLSLLTGLAAPFIRIGKTPPIGQGLRIDNRELILLIVSTPVALYLPIPELLEVSWIGGGVFLIALTIYILNYIDDEGLGMGGRPYILAAAPAVALLSLYIKTVYGDYFDLIGDFWRNRALYAAIDTGIYSVYVTLSALLLVGRRIRALAPGLYLGLTTIAFITDLTRSTNPVLQAILEANVYLVDLSMELLGYRVEYVYTPLGYPLYLFEGTRLLTIVIIAWPCAGVTGLFLFTGYISTLREMYMRTGHPIGLAAVALGLIGTFLLNIARVDAILLLQVYYGVDAAELFHSTAYEFIFLAWLAIYWLAYRLVRS